MQLSFISFLATDLLELPGLLYEPDEPTSTVAVWLHGMGDNGAFYRPGRINSLAQALTAMGITLLAFNNRGAHDKKRLRIADERLPKAEQSYPGGTHYELIADCVHDIDGSVAYLHSLGYTKLYLIGHSSGANKVCAYDSHKRASPFAKYVLAGAGDDTGLFYTSLGKKKFQAALAYARRALMQQKPFAVMPKYTGMHPFSAQSAADILDPDGEYNTFPMYEHAHKRLGTKQLFAAFRAIDRPVLIVYGALDDSVDTAGGPEPALVVLKQMANSSIRARSDFVIIPQADHSFHGFETEFSEKVAAWLSK